MRFAIVGCGVIGALHAKIVQEMPDTEVVALVDPVAAQRERVAARVGLSETGEVHVDHLADALTSREIDAVSVCTPSGRHAEIAIEALAHGKHVLIEKPVDVSTAAARRIKAAQREAGTTVGVISQHRFDPGNLAIRAAIDDGRFGRVVAAQATVPWWRSQQYYDSGAWRGTWALDGGGAVMNQGVHTVDLLTWFLGEPVEVFAWTATSAHERIEVEDVAVATVRFASGALATILATTACNPGTGTEIHVMGDQGNAIVVNDRLTHFVTTAQHAQDGRLADVHESEEARFTEPESAAMEAPSDTAAASHPTAVRGQHNRQYLHSNAHARQYRDFVDAVASGRPPKVGLDEGERALALVRAVYESQAAGRPMRFDEVLASPYEAPVTAFA
jgi:UDP-N-acetyl-2-amino-2-deoxyglucuronate dehydrogenase